jgi:hypothetical protein
LDRGRWWTVVNRGWISLWCNLVGATGTQSCRYGKPIIRKSDTTKMKEDKLGGASGTFGEKNAYRILLRRCESKRRSKNLGVDGRLILKLVLI